MKYLDEYRRGTIAAGIAEKLGRLVTRKWTIMEVCGGQTHSIMQHGIEQLLPPEVQLVHGPGCPVCVTPLQTIDKALHIASQPNTIFCSFGDMLRVPGSLGDLLDRKALGADVRIVYSPLDCISIAKQNPDKRVVFFAVGFETTAPANAMAAWQAKALGLGNFSLLTSHVLVPPAMRAILQSADNKVQAFLGPGHVCTITGTQQYDELAKEFKVPIVVTGFEPLDILEGIYLAVQQLEQGRHEVLNQYSRSVKQSGNEQAQKILQEVFEVCDKVWRGVGEIPSSGLKLTAAFRDFDADLRFTGPELAAQESTLCISGEILRGLKKPNQCAAFGKECTPETPLGATMVSSEGTCAAYYKFGKVLEQING